MKIFTAFIFLALLNVAATCVHRQDGGHHKPGKHKGGSHSDSGD